jgi:methylisocitrate lyase
MFSSVALSPGARFRAALDIERPLQIVGAVNAYSALLAEKAGFRALYLSGAGVANACHGLPDLGMTSLDEVLTEARRITATTSLPLLVDVDTGWGHAFNIARTIREMARAGVAAVQIEDQVAGKRCGHRPNKELVAPQEMCDRIKAAVDARPSADFVILARTDAAANEGVPAAVDRARAYVAAGADMIFPEALAALDDYREFTAAIRVPVLANLTEFGRTPLLTLEELRSAGVAMALYPLSAFRAMNAAARDVYAVLRRDGTQRAVIDRMQTRADLYEILQYHRYEEKLDALFTEKNQPKIR